MQKKHTIHQLCSVRGGKACSLQRGKGRGEKVIRSSKRGRRKSAHLNLSPGVLPREGMKGRSSSHRKLKTSKGTERENKPTATKGKEGSGVSSRREVLGKGWVRFSTKRDVVPLPEGGKEK